MSCEYCDGVSNPTFYGNARSGKMLFCIRGNQLLMRAVQLPAVSQWILDVNYCPMCGRDLKGETE